MEVPFWSLWWLWIGAALVLGILEVLAPGYVFLGFAIGAAATGLILFNTGVALSLPLLLLVFAALSLIAWLVLRRVFSGGKSQVTTFDHDIND